MVRCFADPSAWGDDQVLLSQEESHHLLHVLRRKVGDKVTVIDGMGTLAEAEIMGVNHKQADLIIHQRRLQPRPGSIISLYQAPIKAQKFDWIVQKATELGALHIVPVETEHTEVRIKARHSEEKTARWQAIAVNACKQCGSAWLPKVYPPQTLSHVLERTGHYDLIIAGALGEDTQPLRELLEATPPEGLHQIAVFIGPEGDFSPAECDAIRQVGARLVSLGDRVLRSETAAMYALSVLAHALS